MKIQKSLLMVGVVFLFVNCGENDDDSSEKKTEELLTSGKWYFESKTPDDYTTCEKKGYLDFKTNGDLILNSFDDSSGTCESLGQETVTYTFTNGKNITLLLGQESQSAVITSISENELKLTNIDTGESLVLDKTEG